MRRSLTTLLLISIFPIAASAFAATPTPVAPGAAPGLGIVGTACPTFHWTATERAAGYELVILDARRFAVDEGIAGWSPGATLDDAVTVRAALPAAATGWTPSLEQCLEPGSYAWMIRARDGQRWGEWSEPGIFRVETGIDDDRLRRVVREVLDERDGRREIVLPETLRGAALGGGVVSDDADPRHQEVRLGAAGVDPTVGLRATSTDTTNGSAAVLGASTAMTGFVHGVKGTNVSSGGPAVYGLNSAATSPQALAAGVRGDSAPPGGLGVYGYAFAASGSGVGVRGDAVSPSGYGVGGVHLAASGAGAGVLGTSSSAAGFGGYFVNGAGGDLLAGSDGSQVRFRVNSTGSVFADGAYNCGGAISDAAGTLDESEIAPCLIDDSPADFAEMLPTAEGSAEGSLEPGDVLALDAEGRLVAASSRFQRSVIGVVSTRPSYLGNSRFRGRDGFAAVALVGIVPVKVTGENGPIRAGDLLVASSVRGRAMRAGADEAPQGAVLGKALEPMDGDSGVVRMVAMLQ